MSIGRLLAVPGGVEGFINQRGILTAAATAVIACQGQDAIAVFFGEIIFQDGAAIAQVGLDRKSVV